MKSSFFQSRINKKTTAAETSSVSAAAFSNPDLAPVDEGKLYLTVLLHLHALNHHAKGLWGELLDGI